MNYMILILMLCLGYHPAYSREFTSDKIFETSNYLFFESTTEQNMLLIVGKTETIINSAIDTTTTSGIAIKSYAITSKWKNSPLEMNLSLPLAIAAHPEWKTFYKNKLEMESKHCKFKLVHPDIKVTQGDRNFGIFPNAEMCTYVVYTRGEGDKILLDAISNNTAIDNGLEIIKVKSKSQNAVLDASQISKDIAGKMGGELNRDFTEQEAAFYIGLSFLNYKTDQFVTSLDDLLGPEKRESLIDALGSTFKILFQPTNQEDKKFRFAPVTNSTPVFAHSNIIFDPN